MPKAESNAKDKKPKSKKQKELLFYHAVGRRKESSARVRLYPVLGGKVMIKDKEVKGGEFIINERPIEKYFSGLSEQKLYVEPFRITNSVGRFAVTAKIIGGGHRGQLYAFVHAVSRALTEVDKEKNRPLLRKSGFLTRDPRAKERRKAGLAQKARAKKQSPKR